MTLRDTPRRSPPPGLAEMQREFAALLRTPLASRARTLSSEPKRWNQEFVRTVASGPPAEPSARLEVYHRRYWSTLFSAMQSQFPLLRGLLGAFQFNRLAQIYLRAHAPTQVALARVGDAFPGWFARSGTPPTLLDERITQQPLEALREAVAIDLAWKTVLTVPASAQWRPLAGAGSFGRTRLVPAPTFALVASDWPLVELRQELGRENVENTLALPPRLLERAHWAIFRKDRTIGHWRLETDQAEFYAWCCETSLDDAVRRLERESARAGLSHTPAAIHTWLARSVELGFWAGAVRAPPVRNRR